MSTKGKISSPSNTTPRACATPRWPTSSARPASPSLGESTSAECDELHGFQAWGKGPLPQSHSALVDSPSDGDAGLAEDVGHLGVAQARGVVFEGELIFPFVDMELAQAVGIGKLPEARQLLEA